MNNKEKVTLPSNGYIDGIPKEVNIRGMKGREISTIFSSLTDSAIEDVIQSVTKEELNLDILPDEDKFFILHRTRVLTFGDTIQQKLRCPKCGKIHDYTVKYDDLEVTQLEENPEKDIEIGGHTFTRRIPTKAVYDEINRFKEKIKATPDMVFTLGQIARISKVDGKKMPIQEMIKLLDDMLGKDFVKLSEKLAMRFGLDTSFSVECESCGTDFKGVLGINADLFRESDTSI